MPALTITDLLAGFQSPSTRGLRKDTEATVLFADLMSNEILPASLPEPLGIASAEVSTDPIALNQDAVDEGYQLVNIDGDAPPERAVDVQAVDVRAVSGQAVDVRAASGQAVDVRAASGLPVSGQAVDGQPVSGQAVDGQPVSGQAVDGQPVSGQAVDVRAASGQAVDVRAASGLPVSGQAVSVDPAPVIPVPDQRASGRPAETVASQTADDALLQEQNLSAQARHAIVARPNHASVPVTRNQTAEQNRSNIEASDLSVKGNSEAALDSLAKSSPTEQTIVRDGVPVRTTAQQASPEWTRFQQPAAQPIKPGSAEPSPEANPAPRQFLPNAGRAASATISTPIETLKGESPPRSSIDGHQPNVNAAATKTVVQHDANATDRETFHLDLPCLEHPGKQPIVSSTMDAAESAETAAGTGAAAEIQPDIPEQNGRQVEAEASDSEPIADNGFTSSEQNPDQDADHSNPPVETLDDRPSQSTPEVAARREAVDHRYGLQKIAAQQPADSLPTPAEAQIETGTSQTILDFDSDGNSIVRAAKATQTIDLMADLRPLEVTKQVVTVIKDAAQSSNAGSIKTVSLELQPEELGHLKIHVEQTAETITTQIIASELVSTDLLSNQRDLLLEALADLGFKDASVDISHEEQRESTADQQQHNRTGGRNFSQNDSNSTGRDLVVQTSNGLNIVA